MGVFSWVMQHIRLLGLHTFKRLSKGVESVLQATI